MNRRKESESSDNRVDARLGDCLIGCLFSRRQTHLLVCHPLRKPDAGTITASETDLWIDCSPANPNDPTPIDTGRRVCSLCGAVAYEPLLTKPKSLIIDKN